MNFQLLIVPALLSALICWPASAQSNSQSSETLHLAVGAAKTVTLSENTSTGYKWHIDTAQSTNLAAVRVSDLGHQHGSSHLYGAPGTHSWRIEGVTPGKAQLVLAYSRPWEHVAPAKLHTVSIEITERR